TRDIDMHDVRNLRRVVDMINRQRYKDGLLAIDVQLPDLEEQFRLTAGDPEDSEVTTRDVQDLVGMTGTYRDHGGYGPVTAYQLRQWRLANAGDIARAQEYLAGGRLGFDMQPQNLGPLLDRLMDDSRGGGPGLALRIGASLDDDLLSQLLLSQVLPR